MKCALKCKMVLQGFCEGSLASYLRFGTVASKKVLGSWNTFRKQNTYNFHPCIFHVKMFPITSRAINF